MTDPTTPSGIEIKPVYHPSDVAGDYEKELGEPG